MGTPPYCRAKIHAACVTRRMRDSQTLSHIEYVRCGLLKVSIKDGTDGWTDGCETVTLCLLLDMWASVIIAVVYCLTLNDRHEMDNCVCVIIIIIIINVDV